MREKHQRNVEAGANFGSRCIFSNTMKQRARMFPPVSWGLISEILTVCCRYHVRGERRGLERRVLAGCVSDEGRRDEDKTMFQLC